jgi:1-acyl-sn-glycerol-3-phosphate acyltransferase
MGSHRPAVHMARTPPSVDQPCRSALGCGIEVWDNSKMTGSPLHMAASEKCRGEHDVVTHPVGPLGALARRLEQEHAPGVEERDPEYIKKQIAKIRALTAYFSPTVRGLEYLPCEDPALVIGNHNAAFYMPDTWVTALAIVDRRGTAHPAYTLTYDLLFALPLVGTFLRRIGAIPAASDDAAQALAEGALVLDYPGGDWEACRPWSDRNRIDFGGRCGFARLALQAGVPIVPVVAHGSHDSVVVLARGDRIARWLGLPGMHIKVFPILLGPLGIQTSWHRSGLTPFVLGLSTTSGP